MKDLIAATPGEVAYNAYCNKSNWKSLVSGQPLPPFKETKKEIQEAWEAAAEAVLSEYGELKN